MFNKIKELFNKYREIILYVVFGAVTTLTNWIVYEITVRLMKLDLTAVKIESNIVYTVFKGASGKTVTLLFAANFIAWLAAVIVAFVTNKIWVFESKSWKPKTVVKEAGEFTAARIATGFLEWFGVPALVIAGMNQYDGLPAKILVSIIVVIVNYFFSKFIIFKKKKSASDNSEEDI